MADRGDAVQVTVYLDSKTVTQIDKWAKRLGKNRSAMTRILIDEAMIECGLDFNIITSAPSIAIINLIRQATGKPLLGIPPLGPELTGAIPAA